MKHVFISRSWFYFVGCILVIHVLLYASHLCLFPAFFSPQLTFVSFIGPPFFFSFLLVFYLCYSQCSSWFCVCFLLPAFFIREPSCSLLMPASVSCVCFSFLIGKHFFFILEMLKQFCLNIILTVTVLRLHSYPSVYSICVTEAWVGGGYANKTN